MNDFELLIARLRQWQRWSRLQKAVYYGGRGFVFGILASATAAIFLIYSGTLLISEYFALLTVSGSLGLVIAAGISWFWPQSQLKLARSYDQVFDLKERVSTAIELSQRERLDQYWQELQLADALEATQAIVPQAGLRWHVPIVEISLLLFASVLALGSWFYGQGAFQQAEIKAQNQRLVESELENLEELISDIQNSEQLSAESKKAIISPLQESLEDLKQADSLEEAVSALSEAQHTLEDVSLPGSDEFERLQSAGEELVKNQDSPLNLMGEALSQGNLQAAAENLAALDLSTLNAQELSSLAEQFMDTAGQLENSSPELAKQLQQGAEALQNNDLEAAKEAIANASETLSESAQRAEVSETARKSAQELIESQGRLMAATMFGASAQSSGMQANSSESPEIEQKGSFGSQAGSGEFEESKTPGKEAGLTPLTQNTTPGDSSEKQYESVYAPQRLGGMSDAELSLGTGEDAASNAIGGISNSFEQNAQSFVPYSEIFTNYDGNVQQALESGLIPLSLQPLIRDYFSSLEPR